MAGDWIKMRSDLGTDPAVIRIGTATGLDPFGVVGRLHALWAWADAHTTNGTAPGVTSDWVDRLVCHQGFATALVAAGWLVERAGAIEFPRFGRHMGDSAKRRATETARKRSYRDKLASRKRPARVPEVSREKRDNVPPEPGPEKRREEEEKKEIPPIPPAPAGGGECAGPEGEQAQEVGPNPAAVAKHWNVHPGLIACVEGEANRDRIIRQWATGNPLWVMHWRAAISFMGRTPFYCGGGQSGWRADLKWLMRSENFASVVERMLAERPATLPFPKPPGGKRTAQDVIAEAKREREQKQAQQKPTEGTGT